MISYKYSRKDYIDYYLREGYSFTPDKSATKHDSFIQSEEVYDIFNVLMKIFQGKFLKNNVKPIYSLYNRSSFILNFHQILT